MSDNSVEACLHIFWTAVWANAIFSIATSGRPSALLACWPGVSYTLVAQSTHEDCDAKCAKVGHFIAALK